MGTRLILSCALLALTACASFPNAPVAKQDVVGSYYSGNGLGKAVSLDLKADGSYAGSWDSCMGVFGSAHGRWRLVGDVVEFTSLGEDGEFTNYLSQARTLRHDGKVGFARREDLQGERVAWDNVFLKSKP
ncbi:hypothetical protein [Lysobacter gummosus]|uniref:Lipoprotein n=2 Tax=Lysobacter gummosus TaxID=262324 RepID=A0ABY3X8E3_9GAMM|nr:hypothetical protein [Lysobacter gummosus]UNP28859.1 hypothetical protein MOV92_20665 [Lysobacter gummosus]